MSLPKCVLPSSGDFAYYWLNINYLILLCQDCSCEMIIKNNYHASKTRVCCLFLLLPQSDIITKKVACFWSDRTSSSPTIRVMSSWGRKEARMPTPFARWFLEPKTCYAVHAHGGKSRFLWVWRPSGGHRVKRFCKLCGGRGLIKKV